MSVDWYRLGNNKNTHINKKSTNNELFIESVCKEDEGEYQAVLSIEEGRIRKTIQSNVVFVHVVGGMILLIDINLNQRLRLIFLLNIIQVNC